ncbi:MAG TPA: hypothetical protein PKX87_04400 [Alphaproteobacteria bacterium]|nr:hypothetical protein [Alphaproteobacteria bacterium]
MTAVRVSKRTLVFFAMVALLLTGCETMNDIGARFADFRFASLWPAGGSAATVAAGCPEAEVVQELRNLNEFAPMAPQKPDQMVSSVRIANLKTICRDVDSTSVTLDLAVTLTGTLGPKARINPTDKPSFAYPYFVALTTGDGKIVAKEIHAISLAYGKGQNMLTQEETLSHTLPVRLSARASNGPYRLLVGFQLSDDQLAYNRDHPEPKIDTAEIVQMVAAQTAQTTKISSGDEEQTLAALSPAAGSSSAIARPPRNGLKPARPDPALAKDTPNPQDLFP